MNFRGIIDTSLGGYLTFRGFAKLGDIEQLSEPDSEYQRDLIQTHSQEINDFLSSGKNLFFPEVILGCKLADDSELEKLGQFYTSAQDQSNSKYDFNKMKIELQTSIEFQSGEELRSKGYFRAAILNFLRKHQTLAQSQKPFKRIDGNHRISAGNTDNENIKNLNVPFCIVFFRNKEEEDKYSRIIFHNINYKSIPLGMEDSLRLILDNSGLFPDEELKISSSFGWEYYFSRKIQQSTINTHFSNIKDIFDEQFRTIFLKLFKTLIDKGLLEQNEDAINTVNSVLTDINSIYSHENLKNSKSGALFSAFVYYKLSDDKQLEGFKNWVLKNHIYTLTDIEPQAIIDIYDKIAKSKIKNIFVAMAFSEANCNNVWDAISTVYDDLIRQDGLQLDMTKIDSGKYIPNRVDKAQGISTDIIQNIKEGIANCDLAIVDLTYEKQNVYYELGLAEAQQKPLILLIDKNKLDNKVHFDVYTKSRMQYDSGNFAQFRSELKDLLKKIIEEEN